MLNWPGKIDDAKVPDPNPIGGGKNELAERTDLDLGFFNPFWIS